MWILKKSLLLLLFLFFIIPKISSAYNIWLKADYLNAFNQIQKYDNQKLKELTNVSENKFKYNFTGVKIQFWSEWLEQNYYDKLMQKQKQIRKKIENLNYNIENNWTLPEEYQKILKMKRKIWWKQTYYYFMITLKNAVYFPFSEINKTIVVKPFLMQDKKQTFDIVRKKIDKMLSNYSITEKERYEQLKDYLEKLHIKYYDIPNYFNNLQNQKFQLQIGELRRVKFPVDTTIFTSTFFIPEDLKNKLGKWFDFKKNFVLYAVLTRGEIEEFLKLHNGENSTLNYTQSFFKLPEETFQLKNFDNKSFLVFKKWSIYNNNVGVKYNYIIKKNTIFVILLFALLPLVILFAFYLFKTYYNIVFTKKVQVLEE